MTNRRQLIVVYRKLQQEPYVVFALFPQIPMTAQGRKCLAYLGFGQVQGVFARRTLARTLPASSKEYQDLHVQVKRYVQQNAGEDLPEIVIQADVSEEVHWLRQHFHMWVNAANDESQ